MVAAEEHRAAGGHALEVAHVDPLEEEPQPEAPDGAEHTVEAIRRFGGRRFAPTVATGSTRGRGLAGHHAPPPTSAIMAAVTAHDRIARLPDLVNGDEGVVHRGRFLTTTFLLGIDDVEYLVRVSRAASRASSGARS